MVFFDIKHTKNDILQYFFASFFCFIHFVILFIFNTLSFYIVLKSVKIRKLFCGYEKRLYLCGVFKRIRKRHMKASAKKIDNLNIIINL